jgi:MFS family permease
VLYGVFMIVERTARTPLMHPNLLSRRPIAAGAFLIFIAAGMLIADLFLGSQYLQHLRGLSALETGVFFLPAALALMIGAIAAGRLVGTVGTRPVAVVGLALVAIGNGLLVGVPAGETSVADPRCLRAWRHPASLPCVVAVRWWGAQRSAGRGGRRRACGSRPSSRT